MKNCIFCKIVKGVAETTVVYRDDIVSSFMDIQPINAGHVIVTPSIHASCLAELDEDIGAHMFSVAHSTGVTY